MFRFMLERHLILSLCFICVGLVIRVELVLAFDVWCYIILFLLLYITLLYYTYTYTILLSSFNHPLPFLPIIQIPRVKQETLYSRWLVILIYILKVDLGIFIWCSGLAFELVFISVSG